MLDLLPPLWGEELCAALFVAMAVVRPGRLRRALAWAAHYPRAGRSALRLAVEVCAYQGRFRAKHALLGMSTPADLLPRVRLVGQEHLRRAGGALLLGFHVGPPTVSEGICLAGHPVRTVQGIRHSRAWSSRAWAPMRAMAENFPLSDASPALGAVLYRARWRLLNGDTIYLTADGGRGRPAFSVLVPGAPPLVIQSGWLVLRRDCAVPVLPVVAHMEDGIQVITIHPPLPNVHPDHQLDIAACRDVISLLLANFARQFPEQCGRLLFPD